MKQGRWHDAIADCTCALDLDPKFFKALMRRGAALLEIGEAGSEARALPKTSPPRRRSIPRTRRCRGSANGRGARSWTTSSGRGCDASPSSRRTATPAAAGEEVNATTEANAAGTAEEAKSRGNDLFKAKRYADAVTAYTEALAADPTMSAALCNRSWRTRYLLGEYAAAEADAAAAANLDPTYVKAFHRRAAAR